MQEHTRFAQQNMYPVILTSDKTDGVVERQGFYKLMLDAYGIEYKSYPRSSFVILTS